MRNAELAFQAKDIQLQVRTFSVEEALSQPFEAFVTARSEASDIDLDAVVGHPAAFRLAYADGELGASAAFRVWSGVCSHMELVKVEPDGLSTYCLRIVPLLWRCSQRRNHRIFQHVTAPEIVTGLLAEWGIEPVLRLDLASYPRHEYRVQYGETDFAFICRMLEEAGIGYRFDQVDGSGKGRESELPTMQLVLTDHPSDAAPRLAAPVAFVGDTGDRPQTPFIRQLRLSHQVRPGRYTMRDFDFRSSPDLELIAGARIRAGLEERYELYHYVPGAFLREPGATGGAVGEARVDEKLGQSLSGMRLDGVRTGRRALRFETNVLELAAGWVFTMTGHPRAELGAKDGLLVTRMSVEGDVEQLTEIHTEAMLAADPCRPALRTPKPRLSGLQSAIVVGPKGEEIYTDRFGRVRVQFHWDRVGKHDEHSSCWVRVSQGWAGSGYGLSSIPRIGHEVLVDFFEGDPDQPVIVGSVHNSASGVPYALPDHKTKTVWKSSTSPGSGGSNEITFEDAKGEELLYLHAQRNLEQRVELDELRTVGANLRTLVSSNEDRRVAGDQTIGIEGNRSVKVHGHYATHADAGLQTQVGETGIHCENGKLTLSNGTTSLVLDGPNIYIDAAATLRISAGRSLSISGQQVRIDGGPNVYINCGEALAPTAVGLDVGAVVAGLGEAAVEAATGQLGLLFDQGTAKAPGGLLEAEVFDQLLTTQQPLADLPEKVKLPAEVNEQLQKLAESGEKVKSSVLDPKLYDEAKAYIGKRLEGEKKRLTKLRDDLHDIFARQRDHVVGLKDQLLKRYDDEKANLKGLQGQLKSIFNGDKGGFIDSCKALYKVFDEQRKHVMSLRKDILEMIDTEKKTFLGYVDEWKGYVNDVRSVIDHFKELVHNPGDALLNLVLGEDTAKQVKDAVKEAEKAVDTIKDLFHVHSGEMPGDASSLPSGFNGPTPDEVNPPSPGGSGSGAHMPGSNAELGPKPADGSHLPGSKAEPGAQPGHGAHMPGSKAEPGAQPGHGAHMPGSKAEPGAQPGHGSHMPGSKGQAGAHPGHAGHLPGSKAQGVHAMPHGPGPEGGLVSHAPGGSGHGQAASMAGGAHVPGALGASTPHGGGELGALGSAASSGSAAAPPTATALARQGGLAATDVSSTVRPEGMSFLQTPREGQLMVVASQAATPLSPSDLSSAIVDAQMAGQPVQGAVSQALAQRGYAVYERPWGDFIGEFVRVAPSGAG